jgi:replicative DNA helicase
MDNQLKERTRRCMGEYLQQKGLPLRKPFHCLNPSHEDRHPSMSYSIRTDTVHCFSCGVTYDVFDLVGMDYGLQDFQEKLAKASALFGIEIADLRYEERKISRHTADAPSSDRDRELADLKSRADPSVSYFLSRGVTEESCRIHGLFELAGRAYFPVLEKGHCTGWCARAMEKGAEPRYKNSAGALGLWNGDRLMQDGEGSRLFVTEGIVDALCLEQMGLASIALCGSQNTGKLLRRLEAGGTKADTWRFVACGDPDSAGRAMNETLKQGLQRFSIPCDCLPLEEADGDIGLLYLENRPRLEGLLGALADTSGAAYAAGSAAAALDDFFAEMANRAKRPALSTGFSCLDKLLDGGFYPGLYVLGAISSLGKTSLILQIADYIAETACDVLFFSLEQSRRELLAKSLSRVSAQLNQGRREAFTARQLLSGQYRDSLTRQHLLADTREAYAAGAKGLFFREGLADIGTPEIREAVREHREQRRSAPMVVVDYLQILRPADARSTDKQNTDRAVVDLKRISRDFDIPVIAVSSFNRENYRAAVSMEAFKESGAVEYSSDVLFGLQLQGAGEKGFDTDKAKSRDPRLLELVMLKNRNGIPYAKVPLKYTAKFSLFEE